MKTCLKCRIERPLEQFGAQKSGRGGLAWWCRSCNAAACKSGRARRLARTAIVVPDVKPCSICAEVLSKDKFYTDRGLGTGLSSVCRDCNAKENRRRRNLDIIHHKLKSSYHDAKKRAKQNGLLFDLSFEYVLHHFYGITHCPILKLELDWDSGRLNAKNAPSLDRIDNSRGYVEGNIHIISFKANRMKSDASREELKLFAQYFA